MAIDPPGTALTRSQNNPTAIRFVHSGIATDAIKASSALSRLKIRVKGFQFNSGIFDGELPINAALFLVAEVGPG